MIRMESNAGPLSRSFQVSAASVPAARQAMLRFLAVSAEREAVRLSSGSQGAEAGAYPIPARTGFFRRSFGHELQGTRAIVFNASVYARSLHEGFRPYGNPHAAPIRPRRYFDDALNQIDVDQAARAWEGALR